MELSALAERKATLFCRTYRRNYDDALSDAYFGIAKGLKRCDDEGWLAACAWHAMIDGLRKELKHHHISVVPELTYLPAELADPDAALPAMRRLPKMERAVVRRCVLDGETLGQVSRKLRIGRSKVQATKRRALERLRCELSATTK